VDGGSHARGFFLLSLPGLVRPGYTAFVPDQPPTTAWQRARQFRIIGAIVLVAGIISAGIIYWLGTRALDLSGDISMIVYNKPQERQMTMLYGKSGEIIEGWSNDLKQPGTQAIIIIVAAALIAGGCFYFARLHDYNDETH
jgi:hypothetical protein